MCRKRAKVPIVIMLLAGCGQTAAQEDPEESYVHPPNKAVSSDQRVFHQDHLVRFYDVPGEYGYILEGKDYGFDGLSIITTDTRPGGGPPLHSHDTEEAHVLQEGSYRALIGEQRIDVVGPAIVRIPADTPHTFVNTSDRVIHVIGIIPGDSISYTEIGANPLLEKPEGSGQATAPAPGKR